MAQVEEVQHAFEIDALFGMEGLSGQAGALMKKGGEYTRPTTQRVYVSYERGWRAHKSHVDRQIETILKNEPNLVMRDALHLAFTKLRMAL